MMMPQRLKGTKIHKACDFAGLSELVLRPLREMYSKRTHVLVLPNLQWAIVNQNPFYHGDLEVRKVFSICKLRILDWVAQGRFRKFESP
jgi:hypothetical protein